jgi:hypothetical protein
MAILIKGSEVAKEIKEELKMSDDSDEEEDWTKIEKEGKFNYSALVEEKPGEETGEK